MKEIPNMAKERLIISLLMKDTSFVSRAFALLYERQTYDEKKAAHTRYRNCQGFNRPDAQVLSKYARLVGNG